MATEFQFLDVVEKLYRSRQFLCLKTDPLKFGTTSDSEESKKHIFAFVEKTHNGKMQT